MPGQFSAADLSAAAPVASGRFSASDIGDAPSTAQTLADVGSGFARGVGHQAKGLFDTLSGLVDPQMAQKVGEAAVDAQIDQWHQAKAEYAKGNYGAALTRGLGAVVPFIGPLINNASEKLTSGDPGKTGEGASDIITPILLMKAAENAPEIGDAIREHVGNAVSAAKSTVQAAANAAPDLGLAKDVLGVVSPRAAHAAGIVERGVKLAGKLQDRFSGGQAPAPTASAAAPQPASAAAVPSAAAPRTTPPPAATIGPEYLDNAALLRAADARRAAAAASPPAGVPLPASRQLAASRTIVTPAPADTSGVIPGWKPTILENEHAAAPAPAASAPDLDGVAQGFGFKDFASVKDPRAAETIQRLATQVATPNPAKAAFDAARKPPSPEAPPEAAPPQNPAPTPPSPAAPAAPAAATPPAGAIDRPAQLPPKLITQKQLTQWANENGLSVDDAESMLESDHNTRVIDRSTLNRTLHAITGDHETLSNIAKSTYNVDSLRKLSDEQMLELADKLSKEQAEPDLTGQLQQSVAQARARRVSGPQAGTPANPRKAAFDAARAKQ